jgi:hypothetical protein
MAPRARFELAILRLTAEAVEILNALSCVAHRERQPIFSPSVGLLGAYVQNWRATRSAAAAVPGTSPTPRPYPSRFPRPILNRSVSRIWRMSVSVTISNRRVRTRTHGGVAGVSGQPLPLCRSSWVTGHRLALEVCVLPGQSPGEPSEAAMLTRESGRSKLRYKTELVYSGECDSRLEIRVAWITRPSPGVPVQIT